MVPPERRLGRVLTLVDEGKSFTLTGGRQTGKTTSLMWLVRHLNASGTCRAMWVDLQAAREDADPKSAFSTIFQCLKWAVDLHLRDVGEPADAAAMLESPRAAVLAYLRDISARCPLPLVVFFDEADGLVGEAMVSFLTQLRQGYIGHSEIPFRAASLLWECWKCATT
jgi:hypothetical protein